MYKIGGAHLQCVNNHSAKFEYKVQQIFLDIQEISCQQMYCFLRF